MSLSVLELSKIKIKCLSSGMIMWGKSEIMLHE